MKVDKKVAINIATHATNVAIKNSELVRPYVKESHYRRGSTALNALYFALKFFNKG